MSGLITDISIKLSARTLRERIILENEKIQKLPPNEFLVIHGLNRFGAQVGVANKNINITVSEFPTQQIFVVNELEFLIFLQPGVEIDHSR